MRSSPVVAGVRFLPAAPLDRVAGLLGRVSFELGLLALDGVPVRRDAAGGLRLEYPEVAVRVPGSVSVRVLDDAAWQVLGEQVVADLERQGALEVRP